MTHCWRQEAAPTTPPTSSRPAPTPPPPSSPSASGVVHLKEEITSPLQKVPRTGFGVIDVEEDNVMDDMTVMNEGAEEYEPDPFNHGSHIG